MEVKRRSTEKCLEMKQMQGSINCVRRDSPNLSVSQKLSFAFLRV
jgi:hypothetical protein